MSQEYQESKNTLNDFTKNAKQIHLVQYSEKQQDPETIKQGIMKSYSDFFNLQEKDNLFELQITQEQNEINNFKYFQTEINIHFNNTNINSFSKEELIKIYFFISLLKNKGFYVNHIGVLLNQIQDLFSEIDCENGLCSIKNNLDINIDKLLEDLKNNNISKNDFIIQILGLINNSKTQILKFNQEYKNKYKEHTKLTKKIIKQLNQEIQEIKEGILITLNKKSGDKQIEDLETTRVKALNIINQAGEKLSSITVKETISTTKIMMDILDLRLEILTLLLEKQSNEEIYNSFHKKEPLTVQNWTKKLFNKVIDFRKQNLIPEELKEYIEKAINNQNDIIKIDTIHFYFKEDKYNFLFYKIIDVKNTSKKTLNLKQLFYSLKPDIYYYNNSTYVKIENFEILKINGEIVVDIDDKEYDLFGKKYIKIETKDGSEYLIDEYKEILKINGEVIIDIYDEYDLFGEKYRKIETKDGNKCLIDENKEILKINGEIVVDIDDKEYNLFGEKYRKIKTKDGNKYLIDEYKEILKINGEIITNINDTKFKIKNKECQEVETKNGSYYYNNKNRKLIINNKEVINIEIIEKYIYKITLKDNEIYYKDLENNIVSEKIFNLNNSLKYIKNNYFENEQSLRKIGKSLADIHQIIIENIDNNINVENKEILQIIQEFKLEIKKLVFSKLEKYKTKIQELINSNNKDEKDYNIEYNDIESNLEKILNILNTKNYDKTEELYQNIITLFDNINHKIDIKFNDLEKIFDYLKKENLEKIQNFKIEFSEPEYFDEDLYKKHYETYMNDVGNIIHLYDLGIRSIDFSNSFTEIEYMTFNNIIIDSKYNPNLKKLKNIIEKLEGLFELKQNIFKKIEEMNKEFTKSDITIKLDNSYQEINIKNILNKTELIFLLTKINTLEKVIENNSEKIKDLNINQIIITDNDNGNEIEENDGKIIFYTNLEDIEKFLKAEYLKKNTEI